MYGPRRRSPGFAGSSKKLPELRSCEFSPLSLSRNDHPQITPITQITKNQETGAVDRSRSTWEQMISSFLLLLSVLNRCNRCNRWIVFSADRCSLAVHSGARLHSSRSNPRQIICDL